MIEKNVGVEWNNKGMSIDYILDSLNFFFERVIAHKFFQSRRSNSMFYMVVEMRYKIVKRDHTYDLSTLQLQQLFQNL